MIFTIFKSLLSPRFKIEYPDPETFIIEPPEVVFVERQTDGNLLLRWGANVPQVRIYAGTQPDQIDKREPVAIVSDKNEIVITGLDPAVRHYFEVEFQKANGQSERFIAAERVLPLEHGVNFRDVGGYPTADGHYVRWGQIYRSGQLANLSNFDQQYLTRLGIKLICDLRTKKESLEFPDHLSAALKKVYAHKPMYSNKESSRGLRTFLSNLNRVDDLVTESYHFMLDQKAHSLGELLTSMADSDKLPMLIHCTAGKDRTGMTCALLLLLLGVDEEIVIADYSLSNRYYHHIREDVQKDARRLAILRLSVDDLLPLMSANPQTLRSSLDHIRENYGSVERYLTDAAGVTPATLATLRDKLLVRI